MHRLNYEKRDFGYSFALAVFMMAVASLALSLIFGDNATGWRFWLMQALYTLAIGSTAMIYSAVTHTKLLTATKIAVKPRLAHIGWGCLTVTVLLFFSSPLNNMIMDAIQAVGLSRPELKIERNVWGLLIVGSLMPAFCEEFVFRGTLAQSLEGWNNKAGALALCGACFALFHGNPAQTVHQFLLGAFLTLLVYRSGSLWTATAVHFYNNALAVALSFTPLDDSAFWSVADHTGRVLGIMFGALALLVPCVIGYLKTTRSVWQKDKTADSSWTTFSFVALGASVVLCLILWISSLLTK